MGPPVKYSLNTEKKAAKEGQDKLRNSSRIYIKHQIDRWTSVGEAEKLDSNEKIAEFLLDL